MAKEGEKVKGFVKKNLAGILLGGFLTYFVIKVVQMIGESVPLMLLAILVGAIIGGYIQKWKRE